MTSSCHEFLCPWCTCRTTYRNNSHTVHGWGFHSSSHLSRLAKADDELQLELHYRIFGEGDPNSTLQRHRKGVFFPRTRGVWARRRNSRVLIIGTLPLLERPIFGSPRITDLAHHSPAVFRELRVVIVVKEPSVTVFSGCGNVKTLLAFIARCPCGGERKCRGCYFGCCRQALIGQHFISSAASDSTTETVANHATSTSTRVCLSQFRHS